MRQVMIAAVATMLCTVDIVFAAVGLNQAAGEAKAFSELCSELAVDIDALVALEKFTREAPNVSSIDYSYENTLNAWRGRSVADTCYTGKLLYGPDGLAAPNVLRKK